jgi:hypothetical protein
MYEPPRRQEMQEKKLTTETQRTQQEGIFIHLCEHLNIWLKQKYHHLERYKGLNCPLFRGITPLVALLTGEG